MAIVDALAKLSFSFWQVVVLVAIFMFRRELKEMIRKIASFKVAGSEITWDQKSDTVAALASLKSELEVSAHPDTDALRLIDTKIRNRLIVALSNIKRGTTYLWPALLKAKPGSSVSVPIRQVTLDRVGVDLDALRGSALIQFEVQMDSNDLQDMHTLLITSVAEEFALLVAEVERSY